MASITIYTTPTCVYCKKAKGFLQQHNIAYTEKDVGMDSTAAEEMIAKSGQMGVPVIDVDGKIIVGFDEGELKRTLGIQ